MQSWMDFIGEPLAEVLRGVAIPTTTKALFHSTPATGSQKDGREGLSP